MRTRKHTHTRDVLYWRHASPRLSPPNCDITAALDQGQDSRTDTAEFYFMPYLIHHFVSACIFSPFEYVMSYYRKLALGANSRLMLIQLTLGYTLHGLCRTLITARLSTPRSTYWIPFASNTFAKQIQMVYIYK